MSKTKKRLVIIGSIVGVIVTLIVFFGLMFNIKSVEVDYATAVNRVKEYSKADILKDSRIEKGNNLLFADYSSNVARLEKKYHYARFEVVRTFPNKVIIYVYERKPVFRILDEQGRWQIYDENLKCLDIVSNATLEENDNHEIPELEGVNLKLAKEEGEFIKNSNFEKKLDKILDGVYAVEGLDISTIMSDITFEKIEGCENIIFILCTFDADTGAKIASSKLVVKDTSRFLKEKIANGLYVFLREVSNDAEHATHLNEVTITVESYFTPENTPQNSIIGVCEPCRKEVEIEENN